MFRPWLAVELKPWKVKSWIRGPSVPSKIICPLLWWCVALACYWVLSFIRHRDVPSYAPSTFGFMYDEAMHCAFSISLVTASQTGPFVSKAGPNSADSYNSLSQLSLFISGNSFFFPISSLVPNPKWYDIFFLSFSQLFFLLCLLRQKHELKPRLITISSASDTHTVGKESHRLMEGLGKGSMYHNVHTHAYT